MFTQSELFKIAEVAYEEFNQLYDIKCEIKEISYKKFYELADKSKIIKDKKINQVPLIIGALFFHEKGKDSIFFNQQVINLITEEELFVKAIFIHEFYHVYFKNLIKEDTLPQAKLSEKRVKKQMNKDFPKLIKYFKL